MSNLNFRQLFAFAFLFAVYANTASYATPVWEGNHLLVNSKISKINIDESKPLNISGFSNGGQFEIRIKSSALDGYRGNTCKHVILRMPWTDPENPNAKEEISEKKMLFDEIQSIRETGEGVINAVVDVKPYVKALKRGASQFSLTQCNAFFFVKNGHVISSLR